jgi:hypothetical protein
VSVTWKSTIHPVLRAQKPCKRMSPWSSSFTGLIALAELFGQVLFCLVPRPRIKGLSPIAEGVKTFPAKCTSSSHISLWRKMTSPPFLQPRVCCRVKRASQPSHSDGRSDGVMPYRMDMTSWIFWAESSVPLTVEGRADSQPCPCMLSSLDSTTPICL